MAGYLPCEGLVGGRRFFRVALVNVGDDPNAPTKLYSCPPSN